MTEKLQGYLSAVIKELTDKKEEIAKVARENKAKFCQEICDRLLTEHGFTTSLKDTLWKDMAHEDVVSTTEDFFKSVTMSKGMKKLKKRFGTLKKKLGKMKKKPGYIDTSKFKENRIKQIEADEKKGIDYYPHKFHVSHRIPDYIAKYKDVKIENKEVIEKDTVSIAGRVMATRRIGRIIFYVLQGDGAQVQVLSTKEYFSGDQKEFGIIHSRIGRGDILGVFGCPGRSKTGEFSVFAQTLTVLAPCFHQLPKNHFGLKNQETRYRQRYIDLILNKNARDVFVKRAIVVREVRKYFDDRHFIEVETPVLQMTPGGAAARPFKTHHNELNMELFMRIAPELYLKQLIVGGLERVYEIGKNFRNEGIDLTHNPEFTAVEFYMAYADYNDLMNMTEELISGIVKKVTGGTVLKVKKQGEKEREVDFKAPWKRVYMIPELEKILGKELNDPEFKFPRPIGKESNQPFLEEVLKKLEIECVPPYTIARMLDELVGKYLEPLCINPSFICDHPQIMSPLAKWSRHNRDISERFEVMCCGMEICNAYTELNCPRTQRKLFEGQAKAKEQGDEEACGIDDEFVTALEYGLAPTAGWGMGIDRLVMIICNNFNIKEVILFPAMKPQEKK